MVAFSERTLRLVLRDDQAKLAEMKLRIKGSDLELANILNFPPACALFEEYMIGEHAPENLFFWKAVERFEDLCNRLEKQLEKLKNGEEIPIRKTGQGQGVGNTALSLRLKTTASVSYRPLNHTINNTSSLINGNSNSNSNSIITGTGTGNVNSNVSGNVNIIANSNTGTNTGTGVDVTVIDDSISLKSNKQAFILHQLVSEKKTVNDGFSQLIDIVKAMMSQYVFEGSENQVNFPGKLRVQLEKDVALWLDSATISLRKTKSVNDISIISKNDNIHNDDNDLNNKNSSKNNNKNNNNNNNKNNKNDKNSNSTNDSEIDFEIKNSDSRKQFFHAYSKGFIIPKDLFVKAKSECYMIMRKDTFARWRFTDQFSTFSDSLQPLANARNSSEGSNNNLIGFMGQIPSQSNVNNNINKKINNSINNDINNDINDNTNYNTNSIMNNNSNSNINSIPIITMSSASMIRQQSLMPGKLPSSQQIVQVGVFNGNQNNIISHKSIAEEKC